MQAIDTDAFEVLVTGALATIPDETVQRWRMWPSSSTTSARRGPATDCPKGSRSRIGGAS